MLRNWNMSILSNDPKVSSDEVKEESVNMWGFSWYRRFYKLLNWKVHFFSAACTAGSRFTKDVKSASSHFVFRLYLWIYLINHVNAKCFFLTCSCSCIYMLPFRGEQRVKAIRMTDMSVNYYRQLLFFHLKILLMAAKGFISIWKSFLCCHKHRVNFFAPRYLCNLLFMIIYDDDIM